MPAKIVYVKNSTGGIVALPDLSLITDATLKSQVTANISDSLPVIDIKSLKLQLNSYNSQIQIFTSQLNDATTKRDALQVQVTAILTDQPTAL